MRISEGQTYISAAGIRVYVSGRKKVNRGALWMYYGYQVNRDGGAIGDWLRWKSDGRDWHDQMSNCIVREADVGMKLSEPCAVILERMIEACETDIALPGKVGPKKYGNTNPAIVMTSLDVWVLEVQELFEGQERHTFSRNTAISDYDVRRAQCSPKRIRRMEEAFGWLGAYVFDHDLRRALIAYATVKARGDDWTDFLEHRNRKYRSEKVWIKRTVYRWIERALQFIEDGTGKNGIILRDGAGLQVARRAAETSCKSITSDLRAAG